MLVDIVYVWNVAAAASLLKCDISHIQFLKPNRNRLLAKTLSSLETDIPICIWNWNLRWVCVCVCVSWVLCVNGPSSRGKLKYLKLQPHKGGSKPTKESRSRCWWCDMMDKRELRSLQVDFVTPTWEQTFKSKAVCNNNSNNKIIP